MNILTVKLNLKTQRTDAEIIYSNHLVCNEGVTLWVSMWYKIVNIKIILFVPRRWWTNKYVY